MDVCGHTQNSVSGGRGMRSSVAAKTGKRRRPSAAREVEPTETVQESSSDDHDYSVEEHQVPRRVATDGGGVDLSVRLVRSVCSTAFVFAFDRKVSGFAFHRKGLLTSASGDPETQSALSELAVGFGRPSLFCLAPPPAPKPRKAFGLKNLTKAMGGGPSLDGLRLTTTPLARSHCWRTDGPSHALLAHPRTPIG